MPSELHDKLSERALSFFRPRLSYVRHGRCESHVADSYVADAIAVGNLQHRFEKHYELPWLKHANINEWRYNFKTYFKDNDIRTEQLLIAEVKVSREDFLKTFILNGNSHDNRFKPVGNLHWIVTPRGLVKPEEVPSFWGLLETSGPGLKEVVKPDWQMIHTYQLYEVVFNSLYGKGVRNSFSF